MEQELDDDLCILHIHHLVLIGRTARQLVGSLFRYALLLIDALPRCSEQCSCLHRPHMLRLHITASVIPPAIITMGDI